MTHVTADKPGGRVLAALFISLLAMAVGFAQPSQGAEADVADRPAAAERAELMTIPTAKAYLSKVLGMKYGSVWKDGSHRKWRNCRNVSRSRVSCNVRWLSGRYSYSGKVYVYYRAADKDRVYFNLDGIDRKLA